MCMSNYVFRVLDKNDDCQIDKDEFDFGFEAAMGYAARFIIFLTIKKLILYTMGALKCG